MRSDGVTPSGLEGKSMPGICASIAALVIALDESGVVLRQRYLDVLKHLWVAMPEDEAEGDAGAMIELVLDLVHQWSRDQTVRSSQPEAIKPSLTIHSAASYEDDRQECAGSERNGCRSKHAPLLGAPFVV